MAVVCKPILVFSLDFGQAEQNFADLDKTSKVLKEGKEKIARQTKKNNKSLKTISKLHETTFPEENYNRILQQKYHLESQLHDAEEKVTSAEDEVFNLDIDITYLMILLSQEALEKPILPGMQFPSFLLFFAFPHSLHVM